MIEIKKLDYYYQKNTPLFQDLNFDLKSGGICGLLGKNGAGKTTLLKLMAGLLFPKTGHIQVMQAAPKTRTPELLQNIFLLPDAFSLPAMPIKRYLACYTPFYPNFNLSVYEAAAAAFELPVVKKLTNLSYGQQKKFLLAFGFATGAKLFLFDEPTNGLDIPSKQQFRKLLATHVADDRSFIISTHQVKDIENLIDSVLILDQGKNIFNQSIDSTAPDLEALFNRVLQGETA
jgi:ABC-2 type transport system ATP-binding protein